MAPMAPVPPPLSGDLYWSLLSHMSLNYLSLLRPDALRELLRLYDFRARFDRQAERTLARRMEGVVGVKHAPALRIYQGAALRGVGVELELDEEPFGGEGEIYLFGAVMERFLAHYVSLNAFCETSVRGKKYGEVHRWSPRTGARAIL